MVNVIGIVVPKIVVLLSIWFPSYESNTKIILIALCVLKLIWDYERSRPGHKGLIYRLTSKAKIEVQDFVVSSICLVLSTMFMVVATNYAAWLPVACGALSVVFSLYELIGNLNDLKK